MPTSPFSGVATRARAFTLVELLVSMVVLLLIAMVVLSMTNATGKIWKSSGEKVNAFQKTRAAFDSMTRQLSEATLNTYWDYFDAAGNVVTATSTTAIDHYGRNSELHFITGQSAKLLTSPTTWSNDPSPVRPTHCVFFSAPLGNIPDTTPNLHGLNTLLNSAGYWIEFNSDLLDRPKFLQTNPTQVRYRYRLMQLTQTTDKLRTYDPNYAASKGSPTYNYWFDNAVTNKEVRPIAENIVALIILPQRSVADGGTLSVDYTYDSRNQDAINVASPTARNLQRNQLPPMVKVTMVAIDETSAILLAQQNGKNAPSLIAKDSFTDSSKFSSGDLANPQDLERLQISLTSKHLNYRVFTTSLVIRGAKWSEN